MPCQASVRRPLPSTPRRGNGFWAVPARAGSSAQCARTPRREQQARDAGRGTRRRPHRAYRTARKRTSSRACSRLSAPRLVLRALPGLKDETHHRAPQQSDLADHRAPGQLPVTLVSRTIRRTDLRDRLVGEGLSFFRCKAPVPFPDRFERFPEDRLPDCAVDEPGEIAFLAPGSCKVASNAAVGVIGDHEVPSGHDAVPFRHSLNFTSPTTVRRSRSPKICCWIVWLNRLVAFTVVVIAPPIHLTPKLPFTIA